MHISFNQNPRIFVVGTASSHSFMALYNKTRAQTWTSEQTTNTTHTGWRPTDTHSLLWGVVTQHTGNANTRYNLLLCDECWVTISQTNVLSCTRLSTDACKVHDVDFINKITFLYNFKNNILKFATFKRSFHESQ